MTKHVYVLGSNSFSGAQYVKHLLQDDFLVTGVSRSVEANPVFLPYLAKNGTHPKNFTFLQADFNHDTELLISALQRDKPAYVVNFAAQGMVAESWQHPTQWFATNTVAPLKLYDFLRTLDSLEAFVQISTPEVYGSTVGVIKESVHYEPSTPYAVSKAAADMNLMAFHKAYGFPVVFTRAANVYGPCQQLYRIIPRTVLYFLLKKTIALHGGGESIRSFIHMHDVSVATQTVMTAATSPAIYHISPIHTQQCSVKDLVYRIAEQMGIVAEEHIQVVGERLGKDAAYRLDAGALHRDFGWEETITLEQGIEDVIQWVKDHFDVLATLPQQYIHKV